MGVETLDAVADRGYYGARRFAPVEVRHTVTLPKPMTSNSKAAALRQAGLPLRDSGGCLRLSCRTKAYRILLHDQGQRFGLATLATGPNALRGRAIRIAAPPARTTDLPMGARRRGARNCAGTLSIIIRKKMTIRRCRQRTSVRHYQVLDGSNALLHETACPRKWPNRTMALNVPSPTTSSA